MLLFYSGANKDFWFVTFGAGNSWKSISSAITPSSVTNPGAKKGESAVFD
jgi:hypothetical protein